MKRLLNPTGRRGHSKNITGNTKTKTEKITILPTVVPLVMKTPTMTLLGQRASITVAVTTQGEERVEYKDVIAPKPLKDNS